MVPEDQTAFFGHARRARPVSNLIAARLPLARSDRDTRIRQNEVTAKGFQHARSAHCADRGV